MLDTFEDFYLLLINFIQYLQLLFSYLCTVFDVVLSNTDKVILMNSSTNASVFPGFNPLIFGNTYFHCQHGMYYLSVTNISVSNIDYFQDYITLIIKL